MSSKRSHPIEFLKSNSDGMGFVLLQWSNTCLLKVNNKNMLINEFVSNVEQ